MKGFLPTLVLGLAMLFMIVAGTLVTVAMASNGDLKSYMRSWMLSEEEMALLRNEDERPPRPPLVRIQPTQDKDRIIQELADRVSSNQVRELLSELRQREQMMGERTAYLDQREAELRIAEADLLRMRQDLQRERQEAQRLIEEREQRYADFAAVMAKAQQQMNVMSEVRRQRLTDQAKLFEAMGKAAWQSLRRFTPGEIAQYLALMETKKAAEVIKEANKDPDYPNVTYNIHQEWLKIDMEGVSGDRLAQLAALYSFMKAEEVAPQLIATGNSDDAAGIVSFMQKQGNDKKAAQLLEAMRRLDDGFERKVQDQLARAQAGGGA